MGWVIAATWIGAAVLALLVLGFCAYELFWKSRRLQGELVRLSELAGQLTVLQTEVAATQQRLVDAVPGTAE